MLCYVMYVCMYVCMYIFVYSLQYRPILGLEHEAVHSVPMQPWSHPHAAHVEKAALHRQLRAKIGTFGCGFLSEYRKWVVTPRFSGILISFPIPIGCFEYLTL